MKEPLNLPKPFRVAIVVLSVHHGNTQKIAQAIARPLNAVVMSPVQATSENLAKFDLVGFGSGIYFGRHHVTMRQLVNTMQHVPPLSFVFSTAGLPFLFPLFHWSLKHALLRQASRVVGEFTCRGWDTVGPLLLFRGINRHHPNESDLQRATQFARQLADKWLPDFEN